MNSLFCETFGCKITIKEINKNKDYLCKGCYLGEDDCNIKTKCMSRPLKNKLVATEIQITLLNGVENKAFDINPRYWELIDSEGYSCGATALCETLTPIRFVSPNSWSVVPGTMVKFVLIFPEMDKDIEPIALLYNHHNLSFKIQINNVPDELAEFFKVKDDLIIQKRIEGDYKLSKVISDVETLKRSVFSRFNNVLTNKEIVALDNQIMNIEFSINSFIERAETWQLDLFQNDFKSIVDEYNSKIEMQKSKENHKKELEQRVEQLYELDPRDFEIWTEGLFKALGYKNVVLTPQSNDKGIDLIAEKNNQLYAIQCKKFKGIVGTPLLQAFLGAMQVAGIDRGFFITTGSYSVEAEKMAEEMPIELIDKRSLIDLIQCALENK